MILNERKHMRKRMAGILLAGAITAGTLGVTSPAEAHSFGAQGPPHTHLTNPGCTTTNCYRWILQNGAIMQGPWAHFAGQLGYVLVMCSLKDNISGSWRWEWNPDPWGSSGSPGNLYPYCLSPIYSGTAWPKRP